MPHIYSQTFDKGFSHPNAIFFFFYLSKIKMFCMLINVFIFAFIVVINAYFICLSTFIDLVYNNEIKVNPC